MLPYSPISNISIRTTAIATLVTSLFIGQACAADELVTDLTTVPNGNAFLLNKIESADKTLVYDTTTNLYGTLLNDGGSNPVNGNYSFNLTVNATEGNGGSIRTFQNTANNLVFNDDVSITLKADKDCNTGTSMGFFQIDNTDSGAQPNTTFKGNVYISVDVNSNGFTGFADAVQVNHATGDLEFAGQTTVLEAKNKGYTAEGILAFHDGEVRFTGKDVTVNVTSDYGVNGVLGSHLLLDNTGTFTVTSTLTDGYGCNAIGMDVDNITITSNVQSVNITVKGAGEAGTGRDGVMGFRSFESAQIDARNFNVSVISPDNPIPEGEEYVTAVGVINAGALTVGEDTQTTIVVHETHVGAIGLQSRNGGTTTIKGNLSINVVAPDPADAIAVQVDDGTTSLGSEGHVVDLTGNVLVGANEESTAILNMAGNSSVAGNVDVTDKGSLNIADSLQVNGVMTNDGTMALTKAFLMVNGDGSSLGTVNADQSTIALGSGSYSVGTLTGSDKTILLNDLSSKVTVETKEGNLTLAASGTANDSFRDAEDAAKALSESITITTDSANDQNSIQVLQGDVNDGLTATLDEQGNLGNVRIAKNTTIDAFGSINSLSVLAWRHEINSLNKRMGELRDSPSGVGTWVRFYGSEMEYGAQSVTSKNTTIQVGSNISVGDWKIGVAANYTDGDATYTEGDADLKNYGVALYGTWFVPCGAYIDLVAKYNRLENDFALGSMTGSYDSNAYGVSAETGFRFSFIEDRMFFEPQVGLSWGLVSGEKFTTSNNVSVDQDDFESLIGRVGFRTGFTFPEKKGSVYARFSAVHDFLGDLEAEYRKDKGYNFTNDDLGGTWVEYGIGANFNWNETTYAYVDLERTSGGELKENYRWNVGLRHVF